MTLKQLKYFIVLSRTCHFSRAASELYVSQSSLSYAISELEGELDVALFERQGNRTVLTRLGKEYAASIEPILEQLDKANKRIRAASKAEHGEVFVGIFPSLYNGFSSSIIKHFYSAYPERDIVISFHDGKRDYDLFTALESGIVEMTFCMQPKPNMGYVPAFRQELQLFVPPNHRLASYDRVKFDDIMNEEYVDVSPQMSSRLSVDEIFRRRGVERKIVNEQMGYTFVHNYVASGFGVAILPYTMVLETYIATYGGKVIRIDEEDFTSNIFLAWINDTELSAPARKVKNFLVENATRIYLDSLPHLR